MSKPELKVVGEIAPPDYKDPVKMLRNLADNIEKGDYGTVETLAIALGGTAGYEMFGGGRDSDMAHCAFLFAAAHARLTNIPWGPPSGD